jgi:predicted  nucleic acid-binding Zn-ribbon protein
MMEAEENLVVSSNHKLAQARNTREYMAAQREIDHTRETLQARQGEMAKLVEAMEAKQVMLAERDEEVRILSASLEKDGEVARSRMAVLEAEIAGHQTERDKVTALVRPDVLRKYSAIRMRRGLAVASVSNGTCMGCNMNIPPQLDIKLRHGSSLETCPYCHRIIYWDELLKDPNPEAATTGEATQAVESAQSEIPAVEDQQRA